jgi:hypothetical protein
MSMRRGLGFRVTLATFFCTLLVCEAAAEVERTFPAKAAAPASLGGTLFFARGERAHMDRARKGGVPAPPPEDRYTPAKSNAINGFVKRGDGTTTVWVDEQTRQNVEPAVAAQLESMSVGARLKFDLANPAKNDGKENAKRRENRAKGSVRNQRGMRITSIGPRKIRSKWRK